MRPTGQPEPEEKARPLFPNTDGRFCWGFDWVRILDHPQVGTSVAGASALISAVVLGVRRPFGEGGSRVTDISWDQRS